VNWRLYLLAAVGAALGTLGDLAGVMAARGWRPWTMHLTGATLWVACYPVWFTMSHSSSGGFVGPAAAWSVMGSALTVSVSIILSERQSRGEWIGFALIILGTMIRGVSR